MAFSPTQSETDDVVFADMDALDDGDDGEQIVWGDFAGDDVDDDDDDDNGDMSFPASRSHHDAPLVDVSLGDGGGDAAMAAADLRTSAPSSTSMRHRRKRRTKVRIDPVMHGLISEEMRRPDVDKTGRGSDGQSLVASQGADMLQFDDPLPLAHDRVMHPLPGAAASDVFFGSGDGGAGAAGDAVGDADMMDAGMPHDGFGDDSVFVDEDEFAFDDADDFGPASPFADNVDHSPTAYGDPVPPPGFRATDPYMGKRGVLVGAEDDMAQMARALGGDTHETRRAVADMQSRFGEPGQRGQVANDRNRSTLTTEAAILRGTMLARYEQLVRDRPGENHERFDERTPLDRIAVRTVTLEVQGLRAKRILVGRAILLTAAGVITIAANFIDSQNVLPIKLHLNGLDEAVQQNISRFDDCLDRGVVNALGKVIGKHWAIDLGTVFFSVAIAHRAANKQKAKDSVAADLLRTDPQFRAMVAERYAHQMRSDQRAAEVAAEERRLREQRELVLERERQANHVLRGPGARARAEAARQAGEATKRAAETAAAARRDAMTFHSPLDNATKSTDGDAAPSGDGEIDAVLRDDHGNELSIGDLDIV